MAVADVDAFKAGELTTTTWETPDGTGIVVHPASCSSPKVSTGISGGVQ